MNPKILSWIRTIKLLIKRRFDLNKINEISEKELTDRTCDFILRVTGGGYEKLN